MDPEQFYLDNKHKDEFNKKLHIFHKNFKKLREELFDISYYGNRGFIPVRYLHQMDDFISILDPKFWEQ